MQRQSFTFHKEWRDATKDLPVGIRSEIYEAIIDYALTGMITDGLKPIASAVFCFVKEKIDKDAERYLAICERNRANGAKSKGRPKAVETTKNPRKPKKPSGLSGLLDKQQKVDIKQENPSQVLDYKVVTDEKPSGLFGFNDTNVANPKPSPPLPLDKETPPTPPIEINPPISPKEEVHTPQEIVEFYNEAIAKHNSKMSKCIKLTDKRKQLIRARMGEYTIEQIHEAITKVAVSAFCNGKGSTGWVAGFDFIFNVNNMPKILEGAYDNRQAPNDTRLFTNNPDKFKQSFW